MYPIPDSPEKIGIPQSGNTNYRYIFLPKWDMASFPSLASQVARHWYLKLNF